jgi:hypothetical protein
MSDVTWQVIAGYVVFMIGFGLGIFWSGIE